MEYRQTKQMSLDDPDGYYQALIHSSGKMVLIDKLLPKLKAGGHRVLIFSQMVRCLDILEDYLVYRKYPFERIDGRIRGNLRQAAIDRFSKPDSDRFVFLLCTKAGGLGINLTAADTVIIYDSDWNPQNDLQAQARCHRIGQQKMVKVYRLLCRNTYEREMFDKASLKLGLDKALLQSMNTSQGKDHNNKQLSKKEIEDLLKKGAYGAIMEEDSAGDKFCEEDIDQILERRTQIITLESEKGSTFSKASFASSGIRADIDIDDPDFWKKWAKKAEIDTVEESDKRYGHDESVVDMSELDSSSESDEDPSIGVGRGRGRRSKSKHGKKNRLKFWSDDYVPKDGEIVYGSWARSECFKVERGLLTFGWGRWPEILAHSHFRRGWRESDVEDCARVILLFCLRYYRGDDKIRSFIWDLITPSENGESRMPRNHMGLNTPVPRGRKNKKHMKKDLREGRLLGQMHHDHHDVHDWSRHEKYDGDIFLENNYKKHLSRHANKVLLRVRMLYYIKHEIIGDLVQHIADGVHISALPIYPPYCDQPPAPWWDLDADRSLLVGTYKHGYECYPAMRNDPALGFLARCGPDVGSSMLMLANNTVTVNEDDVGKITEDEETLEGDSSMGMKDSMRDLVPSDFLGEPPSVPTPEQTESASSSAEQQMSGAKDEDRLQTEEDAKKAQWPSMVDLNTRLRRVITSYQRNFKKEEMKLAQKAKKIERREKIEQIVRERERQRLETYQRKWSRREEADFYRTISCYGVEFDSKIREEVLTHPLLDERLKVCQSSLDLPEWWQPGKHDKDLLIGAAKHGLGRTDFFILNDPELSFVDILRKHLVLDQPASMQKEALKQESDIKFERPEDILRTDKNEIIVKLEKGEGTLKIEKIGMKKEGRGPETVDQIKTEKDVPVKEEKSEVELTLVKGGIKSENEKEDSVSNEQTEDSVDLVNKTVDEKEEKDEGTEVLNKEEENVDSEADKNSQSITTDTGQPEEGESTECENTVNSELSLKTESTKEENKEEEVQNDDEPVKECNSPEKETISEEMEVVNDNIEEVQVQPKSPSVDANKEEDEKEVEESSLIVEEDKEDKEVKEEPELVKTSESETVDDKCEDAESKPNEGSEIVDEKEKIEEDNKVAGVGCEDSATVEMSETRESAEASSSEDKSRVRSCESDIVSENSLKGEESLDAVPLTPKKQTPGTATPQATELKAMFPDLEVIQPLSRLAEIDTFVLGGKQQPTVPSAEPLDYSEPTVAQLLAQSYQNPIKWPKDHILEIRLQHIVYAVEHKEWPVPRNFSVCNTGSIMMGTSGELDLSCHDTPDATPKRDTSTPMSVSEGSEVITITTDHGAPRIPQTKKRKRHIAIDVETERAKLHALLNSSAASQQPSPLTKPSPSHHWEANDESLSEESSLGPTVIPGTSSTLTPIDLSSGLPKMNTPEISKNKEIMNEVQDFSMPSKNKQKSKLDDMLGKLMKKNNCPAEEPVIGKEKKRRKLDEIVLGLSAAKEQKSLFSDIKKTTTPGMISPSVTVTPTTVSSNHGGPAVSSSSSPAPKPFTITVNKWLAEQTALNPEQPLTTDYLAPRRRRPRVDPSLLDWKKLTGEENVSVINRLTGKKITGSKAPQLKKLAQWLLENPMFDVDPKWADLVKERGNLPHDLQKRLPPNERKKGPGRPPLLSSPPGQQSSVNQATSIASTLPFPSLATAGLGGLSAAGLNPSSLLSGLSLGGFDPKNNPLLLPFGGMPNMSALGSMSGLGNLGNMSLTNSLFANLAGLGLPSLAGMDGNDLGNTGPSTSGTGKVKSSKPRETDRGHSSSKPPVSSASSSNIPSSALPFFFPNPSLLYTPLGLGGLNPFSMQPGSMSYDSLAQQCGLLNGSLGVGGANTASMQSTSRTGHKSGSSNRPATMTSTSSSSSASSAPANHRHQRSAARDTLDRQQQQQLQQLLLPHDTHLLESLSRASSMEAALRSEKRAREVAEKRARDGERKEAIENLGRSSASDFAGRSEERPMKKLKEGERKDTTPENLTRSLLSDTSPRNEEWFTRKSKESEMKEAIENLCKTSELLARNSEERPGKRTREGVTKDVAENLAKNLVNVPASDERPAKKLKEHESKESEEKKGSPEEKSNPVALTTDQNSDGAVDIEALLTSSTVSKAGATVSVVTSSEDNTVPAENSSPSPTAEETKSLEESSSLVEANEIETPNPPRDPTPPSRVAPSLPSPPPPSVPLSPPPPTTSTSSSPPPAAVPEAASAAHTTLPPTSPPPEPPSQPPPEVPEPEPEPEPESCSTSGAYIGFTLIL
ncbi:hypothetical protein C0J52_08864 [Blattella germanica]|nr:hypothetical protein C0J52_08864 [Blattella germanica]